MFPMCLSAMISPAVTMQTLEIWPQEVSVVLRDVSSSRHISVWQYTQMMANQGSHQSFSVQTFHWGFIRSESLTASLHDRLGHCPNGSVSTCLPISPLESGWLKSHPSNHVVGLSGIAGPPCTVISLAETIQGCTMSHGASINYPVWSEEPTMNGQHS